MKDRYVEEPATAVITLHAEGMLGEGIRLAFELDTDATEEQLDTLLKLTERYCVVFQTLARRPRSP